MRRSFGGGAQSSKYGRHGRIMVWAGVWELNRPDKLDFGAGPGILRGHVSPGNFEVKSLLRSGEDLSNPTSHKNCFKPASYPGRESYKYSIHNNPKFAFQTAKND
jgi:hypothetical protein